jgi:hypothetical protein
VLVGPLHSQQRAFIEAHCWSIAISSLCVVLRVKETICIVSVCVCLIVTIIAPTRIVHVAISRRIGKKGRKN